MSVSVGTGWWYIRMILGMIIFVHVDVSQTPHVCMVNIKCQARQRLVCAIRCGQLQVSRPLGKVLGKGLCLVNGLLLALGIVRR